MSSMASRSWLARESVIPDMAELSAARVPRLDCPFTRSRQEKRVSHGPHSINCNLAHPMAHAGRVRPRLVQ
jgi:hypothetical protein